VGSPLYRKTLLSSQDQPQVRRKLPDLAMIPSRHRFVKRLRDRDVVWQLARPTLAYTVRLQHRRHRTPLGHLFVMPVFWLVAARASRRLGNNGAKFFRRGASTRVAFRPRAIPEAVRQ
jgi:hypothetical protein